MSSAKGAVEDGGEADACALELKGCGLPGMILIGGRQKRGSHAANDGRATRIGDLHRDQVTILGPCPRTPG